ncbi:MAG TPA: alpha-amylase family glycosyl hydrolase [Balneolales bacterium]|nr:alpha-amylase family glycosyl hydrolase [Balneolales bacterium]
MSRYHSLQRILLSLFFISLTGQVLAQVVTWSPQFPIDSDTVTVYFHAKEGTGGLAGYTGDVYAHTGVITDQSTSSGDWKYVKTDWGGNTPDTKMTRLATDEYKITINNVRNYYGVPSGEKILKMAFVFRSAVQVNGVYLEGKDTGGLDIFVDIYDSGLHVRFIQPTGDPAFIKMDSTLTIMGVGKSFSDTTITLKLNINGAQVSMVQNDTIAYDAVTSASGRFDMQLIGEDAKGEKDTISGAFVINPYLVNEPRPGNLQDGITYDPSNPTRVTLSLFAPHKKFAYVLGDFNDWKVQPQFFMKRDSVNADSVWYWMTLPNLSPGTRYAFQYLIDGYLRVADPYSELVLDPDNDQYISDQTYPNLKPYPYGKTDHIVGVLQTGQPAFNWSDQDYTRPSRDKLVIYELLIRDFIAAHDYATLRDTLNYLQNLGVNAIELMPITEFEGNNSWGYNVIFSFAPDKYYGTATELKKFINECHKRGIAVIMDMVLNHSFGQSPMVRMYFQNGKPAPDSPWFNVNPTHPYNVGYDFNHESRATQYFVDRVNKYWVTNYHIDGYRFDMSKGFTQTYSGLNVDLWGQYDQSRINILERMAGQIWKTNPETYVILEHFAVNSEEKVLSGDGMMLWGNMNYAYNQATMGYDVGPGGDLHSWDFSGVSYKVRTWPQPNLVGYMESHDEERLMYKNLQYGNSSGSYSIKSLPTALDRMKLAGAFFFTIPGPKMIWQFGELGYDYSINYPSYTSADRLTPKPIRWDYFSEVNRQKVYKVFSSLIKLKEMYPAFSSGNFTIDAQSAVKRIHIAGDTMDVNIIGNFDVVTHIVPGQFQTVGTWYDYFSGDPVDVTNTDLNITLAPGQFHIYTTGKLSTPEPDILLDVEKIGAESEKPAGLHLEQNYPNPFNPVTNIRYELANSSQVTLEIYDILGRRIAVLMDRQMQSSGSHVFTFNAGRLSSGTYFMRLQADDHTMIRKMLLLK